MHKLLLPTSLLAAALLGGCATSGANPPSPTRVCNLAANVLQLNVGTVNLFGTGSGTNVAVTYRQAASANCYAGNSGAFVSSPSLTVPAAFAGAPGTADKAGFQSTINTGPAPGETNTMTATSQAPNTATITTFGLDGGAFGVGLEPFNYVGVSGVPAQIFPYAVPLYDPLGGSPSGPAKFAGTDPNGFIPGGGPPAFSLAGNVATTTGGNASNPFNGVSEGLDVFAFAPAPGTYSLSVSLPANTGTVVSGPATATIANAGLLPTLVLTPLVAANITATGGASIPFAVPAAPVTEAYIEVTDYGPTVTGGVSCLRASATNPVFYTIEYPKNAPNSPATLPSGSFCSAAQNQSTTTTADAANPLLVPPTAPVDGDAFSVQEIGFDYPAYEASYPNSLGVVSPSLVGGGAANTINGAAGHQADMTISAQSLYNQPAAGGLVTGGAAVLSHLRR